MSGVGSLKIVGRFATVLRNLNAFDGVTVSELARLSHLTRASVNRYLVSLVKLGYAERNAESKKYTATAMVREFSSRAPRDDWVTVIVRPHLIEACSRIGWPLSLGTIRNGRLVVVENTDAESLLIVYPMREHLVLPPVGRAAGHVLLAFKPQAVCEDILSLSLEQDPHLLTRARYDREKFAAVLEQTRNQGYAVGKVPGVNWATLSVPLTLNGAVDFAVSTRFHPTAVSLEKAVERFVEPLQECAQTLAEKLQQVDTSW